MPNCRYVSCRRAKQDLDDLTMYTKYRGEFYHNACALDKREEDLNADGWKEGRDGIARHKDGRKLTNFELLNQGILKKDLTAQGWEIGEVVGGEWIARHWGIDNVVRGSWIARREDGYKMPIYDLFQQQGMYYMQWIISPRFNGYSITPTHSYQ